MRAYCSIFRHVPSILWFVGRVRSTCWRLLRNRIIAAYLCQVIFRWPRQRFAMHCQPLPSLISTNRQTTPSVCIASMWTFATVHVVSFPSQRFISEDIFIIYSIRFIVFPQSERAEFHAILCFRSDVIIANIEIILAFLCRQVRSRTFIHRFSSDVFMHYQAFGWKPRRQMTVRVQGGVHFSVYVLTPRHFSAYGRGESEKLFVHPTTRKRSTAGGWKTSGSPARADIAQNWKSP